MILSEMTSRSANGKPRSRQPVPPDRQATLGRHLLVIFGSTALVGGDHFGRIATERVGSLENLPHVRIVAIDTAELSAEHLPEESLLRIFPVGNEELERCRDFSDAIRYHVPNKLAETSSHEGCGGDPRSGWATCVVRALLIVEKLRHGIAQVANDDVPDRLRAGQFEGVTLEEGVLHVDLFFGVAGASGGPLGMLVAAIIQKLAAEHGLKAVVRAFVITSSAYQRGNQAIQQTRDRNTASCLALLEYYRNGRKFLLQLPGSDKITTELKIEMVALQGGVLPLDEQLQEWAESYYYFTTGKLGQTERARAADPKKNVADRLDPQGNRCDLSTVTGKTVIAVPQETADRLPDLLINRAVNAEVVVPSEQTIQKVVAVVSSRLAITQIGVQAFQEDLPPRPSVGSFPNEVDESGVEARRMSKLRTIDDAPTTEALGKRVQEFKQAISRQLRSRPVKLAKMIVNYLAGSVEKEACLYKAAEEECGKAAEAARQECKMAMAARPRDQQRANAVETALQKGIKESSTAESLHQAGPIIQQLAAECRRLGEEYERRVAKLEEVKRESTARIRETNPTCHQSSLLSVHDLAHLVPIDPLRRLCRRSPHSDKPRLAAALRDKAQQLTDHALEKYGRSFRAAWHARPRRTLVSYVQGHFAKLPASVILKEGVEAALPLWNIDLVGLPSDLHAEWMRSPEERHDIFFEPIREADRIVLKRATHGISIAWLEDAKRYEEALRTCCLLDPDAGVFTLAADMPVPLLQKPHGAGRQELETLGLLLAVPNSPVRVSREEALVYHGIDSNRIVVAEPEEEWTEAWSRAIRQGRLPDVGALMDRYDQLVETLPRPEEFRLVNEYIETKLTGQNGKALWTQLRLTTVLLAWLERRTKRRQQSRLAQPERLEVTT